ncbi:suppressor of tumorigenicity 14 protein homolog isoform X2 [Ptychodera flava]
MQAHPRRMWKDRTPRGLQGRKIREAAPFGPFSSETPSDMDLVDFVCVVLCYVCLPCAAFTSPSQRETLAGGSTDFTDSCRNGTMRVMTSHRGIINIYSTDYRRVCKFLIKAPRRQYIELHELAFRAYQHESCDKEYVALYDGQNASAPLMAQFCRDEQRHPPKIGFASKGRYIYIEISSQDTTERQQFYFSTKYRLWKKPPAVPFPVCTQFNRLRTPSDQRGGYITSHDGYPGPYSQSNLNSSTPCHLHIITGHSSDRVYLNVFDVPNRRQDETLDCLQVIDKKGSGDSLLGQFCGQKTGYIESKSSNVLLVVTNRSSAEEMPFNLGFMASFTIYYYADKEEGCYRNPTDFECRNSWCIERWMRCDGTYHCPDKTDEIACSALSSGTYTVVFSSFGLTALLIWTVAMILIWRRSKRRKRQFHENSSRDNRRRNASER